MILLKSQKRFKLCDQQINKGCTFESFKMKFMSNKINI